MTSVTASAILTRVAQRERDGLKITLLHTLCATPLFGQLVLRGGSALHGVYLHGRYSEDLDFFANPGLAMNVCTRFGEVGLTLETRTDAAPIYVGQGAVHERVELGIDVIGIHYPEDSFLVPQPAIYRAITGKTAPVRTYPLPALLARKLRYAMRRRFAVDFYDLWIGLEKHPEVAPDIREIVRRREVGVAFHERYQAGTARMGLDALEASWHEELAALMPRVPGFGQVRQSLAYWLPLFENKGE